MSAHRPYTPVSIHAPRVGSDPYCQYCDLAKYVSIHAPRVGSDRYHHICHQGQICFNPRSPCGERQRVTKKLAAVSDVSIHAPRVGSDTPCGSRQPTTAEFQSTLPVWGATLLWRAGFIIDAFQSTLPVWGATRIFPLLANLLKSFNPRSPCGERHNK